MAEKKRDYYTTSKAAELLGVAVSTVQLWTNNGSLQAWTTGGGHRRIEISSVEAMLSQQKPADADLSTVVSSVKTHAHKVSKENLIYLALSLGEARLKKALIEKIKQAHYQVQSFTTTQEIISACEKKLPTAIVLDMAFNDGEVVGLESVTQLKNNIESCPPVLFISEYDNPESRLAAARVGVDRYYRKPLAMNKFIHTLTSLKTKSIENIKPFRILIIDNDVTLLKCYSIVLEKAGMEVRTLSNPFDGLLMLSDFRPDVILTDVFMPECSGPELIRMIRQDERWDSIPFIFFSGKNDFISQIDAINLGAEDFLVKPIKNNQLILVVTATANRARNHVQLNKDLKAALRDNKYQLVTMDEHALVSATDVAGRITHANKKFCEVSGYSHDELVGQNHRLLKSYQHSDSFYEEMWRTISNGLVWHGIICNRKKDGDEYWVESTIVPFLDDKGKPYKYVSTRTDITALRQSEERLKRSQEFANIGSWDWDIAKGNLYWSDHIWTLFGYNKEHTETSYENFLEAVHPDDRDMVTNAVTNCVEKGEEYNIEHRVIWPDGSEHWLHESGDVVRNKDGTALHMLGVVQNIDVRKRHEWVLAESERKLVEAQTLANIGSWHANITNNELVWSDEVYRIFGYEPNSFEPNVEMFILAVHPEDRGKVLDSEKRARETGSHDVIHRIVLPDGEVKHVHELAKAELDTKGNLLSLAGTVQDVTDIVNAKEEAESANRAKSQFLSSMSHELRTPMNAIMGFGQLLKISKISPLTDIQKKNVDEIISASKHLMSLINEVLDLSKIESGNINLMKSNISLSKVVAEVYHLILPLAQKRGIEILLKKNDVEINLAELLKQNNTAWLDETRFKQVILNLLSNAVKYNNEKGKVTLNCSSIEDNRLRISVTDTGIGLSEEQQQQLFKSFNRLGLEQSGIEGTGIGLVITKKLVELMGGSIGVDSQVGVGSTFWIELPIAENREKTDIDNSILEQSGSMEREMNQVKEKSSVLYIEDNPANLRLVEQILESIPNLHMWSAPEPLLGLELAMEHLPDLILLDINLPGMDGFEVLKKLKAQEASRNIPVIAISANAMPKDIKKSEEAGFDGYITKPINVKGLLSAVKDKISIK